MFFFIFLQYYPIEHIFLSCIFIACFHDFDCIILRSILLSRYFLARKNPRSNYIISVIRRDNNIIFRTKIAKTVCKLIKTRRMTIINNRTFPSTICTTVAFHKVNDTNEFHKIFMFLPSNTIKLMFEINHS